jgi:hypothetical protein
MGSYTGYISVLPLNMVLSESITQHELPARLLAHFVDEHMEKHFPGFKCLCISIVFNTDGSLIEKCAGFAIHRTKKGGFGYKISSPAGICTAFFVGSFHANSTRP